MTKFVISVDKRFLFDEWKDLVAGLRTSLASQNHFYELKRSDSVAKTVIQITHSVNRIHLEKKLKEQYISMIRNCMETRLVRAPISTYKRTKKCELCNSMQHRFVTFYMNCLSRLHCMLTKMTYLMKLVKKPENYATRQVKRWRWFFSIFFFRFSCVLSQLKFYFFY